MSALIFPVKERQDHQVRIRSGKECVRFERERSGVK